MNNLSWLIYIAGIVESLSSFASFIAVVFAIISIISAIVAILHISETTPSGRTSLTGTDLENCRNIRRNFTKLSFAFFLCMIITGILSSLTPNRQTVLLIAASEIGERVLNSERMQGVIDPSVEFLQSWMRRETLNIQQQIQAQTSSARR